MKRLVADASAFGPMMFEDESDRIEAFEAVLPEARLIAPPNWSLEMASMILIAERRQRIDAITRQELLAFAARFELERDMVSFDAALAKTAMLAVLHGLTVYDAAYLELAIRHAVPLVTLDRALARAAAAEGLEVLTTS